MATIVGKDVRITIGGVELPVESVEWREVKRRREPLNVPDVSKGWDLELKMSSEDRAFFVEVIAALEPRSRYWRRRRVRVVKRWRRRVARRLGVSYQDFRHFCRTGEWR